MGAPPPDTVWQDDDFPVADVADPDTGLLVAAFQPAYVLPVFNTGNNNSNAGFIYAMTDGEASSQGSANRATEESSDYWAAYVQGVYEGPDGEDNDYDTENGRDGYCVPYEPEYAFVYLEVIRDLCGLEHPTWDATLVQRRTVVHEIGHQFGLDHHPGCVMEASTNPSLRTSSLCNGCLAAIRVIDRP